MVSTPNANAPPSGEGWLAPGYEDDLFPQVIEMANAEPTPLPASIDATLKMLSEASYVADRALATVVFLGLRLSRPILLEGEAGVGKTEIAKVLAVLARPAPDPPAMLRGPRRRVRSLRVELSGPDDGDPPRRSRRRTRQGAHRARHIFRALSDPPPALTGARAQRGRPAGVADRRSRSRRRSVRSVSA